MTAHSSPHNSPHSALSLAKVAASRPQPTTTAAHPSLSLPIIALSSPVLPQLFHNQPQAIFLSALFLTQKHEMLGTPTFIQCSSARKSEYYASLPRVYALLSLYRYGSLSAVPLLLSQPNSPTLLLVDGSPRTHFASVHRKSTSS